jgi:hypothetical protein
MQHWDFPATEPIDLLVEVTAGSVSIIAEQTQTVTVDVADDDANVRVDFSDGRLEVVEPPQRHSWLRFTSGLDVTVTVPAGSRCWVTTASANITAKGELGSLTAKTISGDVTAGAIAGNVDVSSTSGRISITEAGAEVSAKSASGAVELGQVGGSLDVNTVSGKIEIASAAADARVRTASGHVKVGSLSRGWAEITTVSGDIKVAVTKGIGVYMDMSSLSGRVSSELEPSEASDEVDLNLKCRSISGAVKVRRAELADAS